MAQQEVNRMALLLGITVPLLLAYWSTTPDACSTIPLEISAWPGSFGATVETPITEIITEIMLDLCRREMLTQIRDAFVTYRLLHWANQHLTPAQELALMQLLPHDATAAPEKAYGPLGMPGIDAEKYRRWRLPGLKQVLLQGEGQVPAGHHGVAPGRLSSGKPVKEWHTDGLCTWRVSHSDSLSRTLTL